MSAEGTKLWLGRRAGDAREVTLDPSALVRHVMALGSSGSGKTVFCKALVEEAILAGIPAICVDPQGDLCSLAAGASDAEELEARGIDPALAAALAERAEVVIFTPGSTRGVPLCADPVAAAIASLESDAARVDAITRTAAIVVGLLSFDLGSDDGAGLAAVIDRALHELVDAGARPSLAALTDHLAARDAEDFASYARYLEPRKIRLACQRLARLEVGSRRALFHDGVPIDVDVLLGRDPRAPVAPGKTRVAIVYLNTLHQQDDKEFFVAALADRLYAWMLAHPSPTAQAIFYVDEVAPFIPPVRKPACKDGLALLFKQARKYGVSCVMATQNPGDVDYKAMAQFGTWALGRLTTRQDLKKIEPTVKALAPVECDALLERLPSAKPGELVLLSPDQLGAPVELTARWLMTRHETWTEERIEEHTDPMRARFDALLAPPQTSPATTLSQDAPRESSPSRGREGAGGRAARGSGDSIASQHATPGLPHEEAVAERCAESSPSRSREGAGERVARGGGDSIAIPARDPHPSPPPRAGEGASRGDDTTLSERERDPDTSREEPAIQLVSGPDPSAASNVDAPARRTDAIDADALGALATVPSASARELAELSGRSEGAIRRSLARLVESGRVRAFERGRATRYFTVSTGGRPDIDLPGPVDVLVANVDAEAAMRIAETHARRSVLGLIGEDERAERVEAIHRLVYAIDFEEKVERSALARLFGESHDERLGSVYVHPHALSVLVFGNADGVRFDDAPEGLASTVRGLDGVAEATAMAPATLGIDDADWTSRAPLERVRERFTSLFDATPRAIRPLFVPLFHLYLRAESGSLRRMTIDALIGRPVEWPGFAPAGKRG